MARRNKHRIRRQVARVKHRLEDVERQIKIVSDSRERWSSECHKLHDDLSSTRKKLSFFQEALNRISIVDIDRHWQGGTKDIRVTYTATSPVIEKLGYAEILRVLTEQAACELDRFLHSEDGGHQ